MLKESFSTVGLVPIVHMRNLFTSTLCLLFLSLCFAAAATTTAHAQKKPAAQADKQAPAKKPKATAKIRKPAEEALDEESLKARLNAIKDLPVAERTTKLEEFLTTAPAESPSRVRATELLTGARAALGDEHLRRGNLAGGMELFRKIVEEVTPQTSDKLFVEVVALLPTNLSALGHREEALELARRVEERAAGSARRLLPVAGFYLSAELPNDAARAAEAAVALAPDNAQAHQLLGVAYRMGLRLDDAVQEFARALELDPKSFTSRLSLADLRRATGKSEEAIALYRELLASEPNVVKAYGPALRAGLVLALFDAGKTEEGEAELTKALAEQPENLPLLVGASYHFSARGDGARAAEFAERALKLESRSIWVWSRLAYARALLAQKRPLEAEKAIRSASELGRFPTVQYELATALAAAGLYDEAAEELARSFTFKDGRITTQLAGRTRASAENFYELLDLEFRASTMLHKTADTPENARQLKALLAFHTATRLEAVDERAAAEAAREFSAGNDEMRAFRQLYVASKLLERGTALQSVVERTDEAMGGVELASDAPEAVVALLADELRESRTASRATGVAMSVPVIPRDILTKILRGRIEDLAGWSLYHQGKYADAVVRLRRAVSVLPENSHWWGVAEWHLGAALDAGGGNEREALAAYVRSYRLAPQPARVPVIQALYRRINGSDAGLERLLNAPAAAASASAPSQRFTISKGRTESAVEVPAEIGVKTSAPKQQPAVSSDEAQKTDDAKVEASKAEETKPEEVKKEEVKAEDAPPTPAPLPTPTPASTAESEQKASQTQEQKSMPTETAEAAAKEVALPAPSAPSQTKPSGDGCLAFSESSLSIKAQGGSAAVTVILEGAGDISKLSAATPNWADIVILAEPRSDSEPTAQRYTISSVSSKAGTYTITFTAPCGKRDIQVEVK